MNLFALDFRPAAAARAHCDKHVGRMAVEALVLMAGAHELVDFVARLRDYDKPHRLDPRYRKFACARWVRETQGNYVWTWLLADALFQQYRVRYGREHAEESHLMDYHCTPVGLSMQLITPFGQSISPHAPGADPVLSYRRYYACRKQHLARWERGVPPPEWWRPTLEEVGKLKEWESSK
jgi:hypothetical protein